MNTEMSRKNVAIVIAATIVVTALITLMLVYLLVIIPKDYERKVLRTKLAEAEKMRDTLREEIKITEMKSQPSSGGDSSTRADAGLEPPQK